jgi:hypothetical protein
MVVQKELMKVGSKVHNLAAQKAGLRADCWDYMMADRSEYLKAFLTAD